MSKRFDIVAIGEAMVEFNQTSAPGNSTYLQGFGGDTSNAVIAAARQGARCAYVTRLGDDEFGRMCLALWASEGVDSSAIEIDPSAPTGVYFVRHDSRGHSFSYLRAGSAASRMTPQSIASQLLADTRFLHVSGISQAISPGARSTVRHAIESGRAAGASISYDPNLRLRLWPIELARAVIIETMALSDVFLPSLDDLQAISGLLAPADIVDWCHRMGAPWVVLKLGAQGCLVSDGTSQSAIPAFLVDAVDATGAGDCFDGSLLARLADGGDLLTAARWASAAAAIATTGYGAVKPLPSFAEVARLAAAGSAH